MAKRFILLALFFFLEFFYFASAEFDLSIEVVDKGSVIISELNNPAVFDFVIINNGNKDFAEIYSLVGISMAPKGTFAIPNGKSTTEVKAYLPAHLRKRDGVFSFEYQIKGESQGIFKDKLTVRIVPMKEVFSLEKLNIHPDDNNAVIRLRNNVNSNLEDVKIQFKSKFFDFSEKVSLKPYEEINISVDVDKNRLSRLVAGQYPLGAEINIGDVKEEFNSEINYLEKEGTSIVSESSGFIIRETRLTKKNEGNIPIKAKIEMKKDIVSRLFLTNSEEPLSSEREGLFVRYVWEKDLAPQESFTVISRTNYTIPFLVIVLVIVIAVLVRIYTLTSIIFEKRVSFVRTRGGEFALKVILRVRARKNVDDIQVVDRIPMTTKLYEQFGRKPDKVDEKTRQVFWFVDKLNKGEERIFSYIIYSKIRVVGRFELPLAHASFQRDGKKFDVYSNKAYFVSEISRK